MASNQLVHASLVQDQISLIFILCQVHVLYMYLYVWYCTCFYMYDIVCVYILCNSYDSYNIIIMIWYVWRKYHNTKICLTLNWTLSWLCGGKVGFGRGNPWSHITPLYMKLWPRTDIILNMCDYSIEWVL